MPMTEVAPFALSRASVSVTLLGKRAQKLGRVAFTYDGTNVEARGRRAQLLYEGEVQEVTQHAPDRWTVLLVSGDSWTIRKGCGCGG